MLWGGLLFITHFLVGVCYKETKLLRESSYSDKICSSEEIEFQANARSVILCVGQCLVKAGCNSVVYHRDSKTCYGIKPTISCNVFVDLQGAMFYRLHPLPTTTTTTTTTTQPTTTTSVVGCTTSAALLPAVPDNQITASGIYGDYQAYFGRLDFNSVWASATDTANEYIQVNFDSLRVVTSVILQGACCFDEWVITYKLLTSIDCANFDVVLDETNNPKIFTGVSDRNTYSTVALTTPISAQCFKINPVTWKTWPSLRFELMGCLS